MASPGKMMGVEVEARDEAMERRLRVLEGRIGELHREKHEMAGKLNEENRKVYHENTALKLKINDLLKKMEKSQIPLVTIDRKVEVEAESLRADVAKLEEVV
jgi:dynactin complex subunit